MAFDLSTAQPVRAQGAFDLSTARPVGQAAGAAGGPRPAFDIDAFRKRLYEQQAAEYGPLDALSIAIGRGVQTIGQGLGLLDRPPATQEQAYEALTEERPITTAGGEIIGESLPFVPLAVATGGIPSIAGRVAASTGVGALEGGTIASGKEQDVGTGAMVGATVGGLSEALLPVVGRIGGRLVRRLTGRSPSTPILDAQGKPSAELQEALEASGLSIDDLSVEAQRLLDTGVDDPAAVARRDFLERQGLTPTRAQVSGEASDFQAQQEMAKTSGRVRRALEGQEQALANRFENAITATGGSANQSNSSAFDYIADRAIDLDSKISDAYRAAREAAPTAMVVRPDRLADEMRKIAGSERTTGGLVGSVRDILRNKGVLGRRGLNVQGRVTPQVAEDIRIEMNALYDSLTPFGRQRLRDLKNALDDDVAEAVGEQFFEEARSAKAKFEDDLSRAKVNKFDRRRKELVRDILENKINPDRFLDEAVLSRSIRGDDVKQLRDYLLLDDTDAGRAAWNDLRAEAMQRITDTAIREVGGEPALSRAGMERALNRFGPQKLAALFSPDERRFLTDMLRVTQLREPRRGTALGRGPSAQAIGRLEDAVKRIPLVGSLYEGLMLDAQGRIILRPKPERPLQALPAPVSAAVPGVVAASVQEVQRPED